MTVKLVNPPTLAARGGYTRVCEVTIGNLKGGRRGAGSRGWR